jgi:hypothetical protein
MKRNTIDQDGNYEMETERLKRTMKKICEMKSSFSFLDKKQD